jgi:sugar phosphate isomerase/epimerase
MKTTLPPAVLAIAVVTSLLIANTTQAAESAGTGADFKGPIGLQLYSLRAQFAKDVPATLDEVKSFGFKYAELAGTYGWTPEKFKEGLQQRGIQPISGHFPYEKYRDDVESVVKEAKALGLKYAGCAWIQHMGAFTEKQCRETAAVFNKAGEALGKEGIQFFYHTHGYEFEPHGDGTLFDLLMSETDPKKVAFEMDIFWIVHPGQDPVKLLNKYSNRWQLMHVKDMRKGTPTGLLTGSSPVTNDVAIGTGQMDIPAILKAAQHIGVKWYFLEDESPDSEQQIPQSLKYLSQVKF